MSMDKKRGVDNDLDYPIVQRVSSIDSLEQTDLISSISDSLQCISGHHQWFNSHERILVEKTMDHNCHPFFNEQVGTLVPRENFKIPQDDEDYDDDDDDEYSIQHRTYSLPTDLLFYKQKLSENEEDLNDDDDEDGDDDESSFNQMDLSLTPFDMQLQVTDSQTDSTTLYDRFSSLPLEFERRENIDQVLNYHHCQTSDSEMDDDDQPYSESKRNNPQNSNGYSSQNNGHDRNDGSSRRNNRQTNDSTGNTNGSGSNPNRNNNNSRKSDDGGDDHDDDDDDKKNRFNHNAEDEQDDDETDENLARRLGFVPLKDEIIRTIGRLRHLTRKRMFDRRDFETLQFLIDELIQNRHMESFSHDQLKQMIKGLKLDRPFHNTTRALTFLQERIPRRAVKYQVISSTSPTNENVFNIWRERERRARLDSKDSLEDEAPIFNGQKLRDVTEINHPTPPIVVSNMTLSLNKNNTSKVRQMAKDIDTKSTSSRSEINVRTATDRLNDQVDYHPNTNSPANSSNSVSVALYSVKSPNQDTGFHSETHSDERETVPTSSNLSTLNQSEQNRVRKMIHRLESSISSPSTPNSSRPAWSKKSFHEEISDGSISVTSSPPSKRLARRDFNDLQTHHQISKNEPFLFKRDQITNRTTSGSTVDEYVTYIRPEPETSVSMVREVRARVCDDESSKTNRDDKEMVQIKVDVETLYILEQKSEKASIHSSMLNVFVPESEPQTSLIKDQHDFGVQTISPPTPAKPVHRPIGIQVNSTVPQQNCSVQTTDSLHRPPKERQSLSSSCLNNDQSVQIPRSQSVEKKYEIKRRYSSRRSSEDEEQEEGTAVIFIDDKPKNHSKLQNNHFQLKRDRSSSVSSETASRVPEQQPTFGRITSRIHIDKLCDLNRHVVHRHVQDNQNHDEEHRSNEVYEIHTRGTFKCLVISSEESTQYGRQTRTEQQMQRIEQSYTDDDLKKTELHVIVTSSDMKYRVVKRDYGRPASLENLTSSKQPSLAIHYYNTQGRHMCTENSRALTLLPLFIRCEIEYELNHYGSARLIVLSVTNAERRQTNIALKESIVCEILSRSNGRLSMDSPELEDELRRRLAESTNIIHLTDYTSRDEHQQVNSTDVRRVSRIDVTTSLRLVQHYRTLIHHLSRLYRSNLRLPSQTEQQRQLILVARDEYYLLDLKEPVQSTITDIRQRQHDIFKREVNNALQEPFDYAKYRTENQQQQEQLLAQHVQKRQGNRHTPTNPPPSGHPSEAEFYLGSQRRALIEREIHSMRHSIRSHEHTPPQSKNEPLRRSLSICYSGGQRFTRARIIHVKDFYEDVAREESSSAKEQELFIRVDDHINQRIANSLRRSFSTDYLYPDGPRSRVHYIRIPCEAVRSEENASKKPQGVMYANLPYSLRYWNILYILDREARQGRPLGSSLPKLIVNDPYQTLIPPLTQHEIRQTAQQILSPGYDVRSYTDQTLRWFLSRDNRTEIESAKYLQTLNHYRQQQQTKPSFGNDRSESNFDKTNNFFSKKTIGSCVKLSDRLVPVPINDHNSNQFSGSSRSPSIPRVIQAPAFQQHLCSRSQSYPRPKFSSSTSVPQSTAQTSQNRVPFSSSQLPISRHQSVHELHANNGFSHPPSPSPSLHSLNNYQSLQQQQHRRPVAFHNRYTNPKQAPLFTEIIDSQTGRRILTTSQEQLPTEVLGLLNKYNLQEI